MARIIKTGLDYFPFDVDFFNDDKIELISSEFGAKGEVIAIRLLCHIYRNGYFYQWGKDESLLFAKRVGNGVTGPLVDEVVAGLVKRSFFNERVFNRFKILTSKGIQQRYVDAKHRSKEVALIKEYLLIEINAALIDNNVTLIDLNVNNGTQRKEKESTIIDNAGASARKSFKQLSEKEFYDLVALHKSSFTKEMLRGFYDYWREPTPSGLMRFQLEKTWDLLSRLNRWKARNESPLKTIPKEQKPVSTSAPLTTLNRAS